MKYDIIVQTLVNDRPPHVFRQEHGVMERKSQDVFNRVVKEQYERLEKAGSEIVARYDTDGGPYGVTMTRILQHNTIVTVHVLRVPTVAYNAFTESGELDEYIAKTLKWQPEAQ